MTDADKVGDVAPRTTPRTFARALAALSGDHFRRRLSDCRSPRHLASALAYERNRSEDSPARPERIDAITARLDEVRDT